MHFLIILTDTNQMLSLNIPTDILTRNIEIAYFPATTPKRCVIKLLNFSQFESKNQSGINLFFSYYE